MSYAGPGYSAYFTVDTSEVLLVALYLRDCAGLQDTGRPALPPLIQTVRRVETRRLTRPVGGRATLRVEWEAWWHSLLAHRVGDLRLHASDISGPAVDLARRNLAALDVGLYTGDLFDPLPAALRGRIETLLCNTPYVPTARVPTLPPEAREHEPLISLDGGRDGLELQRRVARRAPEWLAPGGHVLFEVGEDQEQDCLRLLRDAGFEACSRSRGDIGATVVIGTAEG